ncbi:MAG: TonB-dependent receptor plug domain-containing protein, partial [Gammaproteobacteria bacterium]|nr:TonB-dependent receptor plug domain-containing protein [Gammaproteobacteria bacterium]
MSAKKSALRFFSLAAGVALVSAHAGPVNAGEAAGARSMVVEEVLVTARKREESLQEVPVAVSAFSQEQIELQTIQEFIDIEAQVPGVHIQTTQHDPSIAAVSIRGQQQPDFLLTNDSAVGAYVDNVNLPRQSGLNANLFDIERIEVLKGPQGTLYGRNTTGGAINIISRKADHDGSHGYLKASYGNKNFTQISGALNIPFSDTAAGRIAVQKTDQDGWGESRFTGDDLYDQDEIFLRGSLVWDPSDRVNIQVQADYMDLDEGGAIEKLVQPGGNFINGLPDTTSLTAGIELSGAPVDFANYVDYVNSGYAAM